MDTDRISWDEGTERLQTEQPRTITNICSPRENTQASDVLQIAYIQKWKVSRGEVVEENSIDRLILLLIELAEMTRSAWVKKQCAVAVESLVTYVESKNQTSPIDKSIFQKIADHYGHPRLFLGR